MKITKFYATDYVDAASYDNLRKIASFADGLKNSGRKVAHTILKKNITKETKVSRLKSTASEVTEYLHGEDNLSDVIVNMGRRYTGTNNLPLVKDQGNFGKRLINDASADRYISTSMEDYLPRLFVKYDTNVLLQQTFEGVHIEPRYFVPILPMLLINGAEYSISTGFAQNILARPLGEMIKATKAYVETGVIKVPKPGWTGFKGKVVKHKTPRKWIISGAFKRINTVSLQITELPVGVQLKQYKVVLAQLREDKIITSFQDRSSGEQFLFNIKVTRKFSSQTDDEILEALKMTRPVTENFTSMGDNNRIQEFDTAEEVFEAYLKLRESVYDLRKLDMIDNIKYDLRLLASKYLFIKAVVEGTVVVNNNKKAVIIKQIEPLKGVIQVEGSYDYLLRMPIWSLTVEKMKELMDSITAEKIHLVKVEKTSTKDMWLDDLISLTKKG